MLDGVHEQQSATICSSKHTVKVNILQMQCLDVGAVRPKNRLSQFWFYLEVKKSYLAWSISKDILCFKNANERPYDVIYSTNSVKGEYLRK